MTISYLPSLKNFLYSWGSGYMSPQLGRPYRIHEDIYVSQQPNFIIITIIITSQLNSVLLPIRLNPLKTPPPQVCIY
ncbi:mCG1051014 [Mus musculus]|nr:mCG1051014 [Mus musculus]